MVKESALLLILTGSSLLLFATKVVMVINFIFMISMLLLHTSEMRLWHRLLLLYTRLLLWLNESVLNLHR